MILSILATVAVLAAIAVIAAALVFAETTLVYIALGLAGASVLLLLGSAIQGRLVESRPGRPGTDGLGKSSVPTGAAMTAATATGTHVETEHSERVPVPARGPVREAPADTPAWTAPAADDSGHGEPEYDVPRWQTPTAHEWPEPDTAPQGAAETAARWNSPAEDGSPVPASEERTFEGPVPAAADTDDMSGDPYGTGEDERTPSHTSPRSAWEDESEPVATPFSYSIPGQTPPFEDESVPAAAVAAEDVPDTGFADTGAFAYRIPREADSDDRVDDGTEAFAPDTEEAVHPSEDGGGAPVDAAAASEAEPAVEDPETGAHPDGDEPEAHVATAADSGVEPAVPADATAADAPDTRADGAGEPGEELEHDSCGADRASSADTDAAVVDTDTGTDTEAEADTRGTVPEPEDTVAQDAVADENASEEAPAFVYRVPDRSAEAEEAAGAGDDAHAEDSGRTSAFTYRLPQPEDGGAVAERPDRDDEDGVLADSGTAAPDTTAVFARSGPQDGGDGAEEPKGGTAEARAAVRPEETWDAEDDHTVSRTALLKEEPDLDDDKDSDRVH
ncbi:hypothetical protein ACFWTE_20565 [Nocardiopsis sp. NPDC058631]|uniref:hypothetical protein n=1 Tax=Nocardiopsis sp. NPDC058631 TaxID=3346566 RepID=UPI00365A1ED4